MNRLDVIKQYAKKKKNEDLRELRRNDGIPVSAVPGIDGLPELDDYDIRSLRDCIISGPLLGTKGPGRVFSNKEAALLWAREKYGENNVSLLRPHEETPRWAILVKNLRKY